MTTLDIPGSLQFVPTPNTIPIAEVSDKSWSDFSQSDYSIEQWRRACLIKPESQTDSKSDYKLPVREPNGTLNRNAVHAAAAALAGGRGGVQASASQKQSAAKSLVSMYRNQLEEDPPESLSSMASSESEETLSTNQHVISSESAKQKQELTETLTEISEANGVFEIALISPGWGSSGYYSSEVLQEAGKQKIFASGTHMFLDHPSSTEEMDRPERSVKDLVAVLQEDARWTGSALVGKAKVFSNWKTALAEMKDAIGVSVRAFAEVKEGEAEGRRGTIIERIEKALSVDFVTRAGRGGRILEVLESQREIQEKRNIGEFFEAQIHRDFTNIADYQFGDGLISREERISLSSAIGDALNAFRSSIESNSPGLLERDFYDARESETNVPSQSAGAQEEKEEKNMPQIEEARLRQLEETEGRVPTLESERDQAVKRAEQAEQDLAIERAKVYAREFAQKRITEANSELPAAVVERIVSAATHEIPLGEDGRLDTAAFGPTVDEARQEEEKYLASVYPADVGRVQGLGSHYQNNDISEADTDKAVAAVFGRAVKGA